MLTITNVKHQKRMLMNSFMDMRNLSKDEKAKVKEHNKNVSYELDQLEKYDRKVVMV